MAVYVVETIDFNSRPADVINDEITMCNHLDYDLGDGFGKDVHCNGL